MSSFCRLDPVDDALNIIAVRVKGWEAKVIKSSVMLLQTKWGQSSNDQNETMKR